MCHVSKPSFQSGKSDFWGRKVFEAPVPGASTKDRKAAALARRTHTATKIMYSSSVKMGSSPAGDGAGLLLNIIGGRFVTAPRTISILLVRMPMSKANAPSVVGPLLLVLFFVVGVGLQMWNRPLPALVLLLFFIATAHCVLTALWAVLVLWKPHQPSTQRRMSALAVAFALVVVMIARDRIANHAAELWSAANHVARDASNPCWWLPAVGMALLALAVYLLQSLAVCALLGWRGGPSLWPHCSDVDDAAELAELRRYFEQQCAAQAQKYNFGLELVRAWRVDNPRQQAAFDSYCAAHRAQGKVSTRARLFHGTAAWVTLSKREGEPERRRGSPNPGPGPGPGPVTISPVLHGAHGGSLIAPRVCRERSVVLRRPASRHRARERLRHRR